MVGCQPVFEIEMNARGTKTKNDVALFIWMRSVKMQVGKLVTK